MQAKKKFEVEVRLSCDGVPYTKRFKTAKAIQTWIEKYRGTDEPDYLIDYANQSVFHWSNRFGAFIEKVTGNRFKGVQIL